MAGRHGVFRIAVRKFTPFESALAKQWEIFERRHQTGLTLEAVPFDLHPLHESLFVNRGLERGEWDTAFISTDWLAEAGESAGLVDLAPYLDASPPEGYPHAWSGSLLRLQQFGNRVLGLPYHDGPECLIYRKDLFADSAERSRFAQEFGESLEVPRTWEQFRRVARFFTRAQTPLYGTAFAAFPDGHNTVYDFCLQLWTRGGELFDNSGRILLDTIEACESLDYYRALLNDATAVHPESRAFDSVKSGFAFAAGHIAMMVNWFGFASMSETITESKVKGCVAVAPVPSGAGPRVSLNAYWILGIAAGSPHRDLTWKFLRHCASAEMDKMLTIEGGIGCRKSTWSDARVNALIPFYHCLEDLHEGARELPRLTNWAQLATVIDRMVLDAINGQEPTALIIRSAQARADHLRTERARTP
jgi:multiple sugar transport system substrate-binding protein